MHIIPERGCIAAVQAIGECVVRVLYIWTVLSTHPHPARSGSVSVLALHPEHE